MCGARLRGCILNTTGTQDIMSAERGQKTTAREMSLRNNCGFPNRKTALRFWKIEYIMRHGKI